ncbi:MAG: HU family DNA-binding protein, partial [Comamonas sp.]
MEANKVLLDSELDAAGALTKAQLADLLFDQLSVSKREAKEMVDAYFDLIANS